MNSFIRTFTGYLDKLEDCLHNKFTIHCICAQCNKHRFMTHITTQKSYFVWLHLSFESNGYIEKQYKSESYPNMKVNASSSNSSPIFLQASHIGRYSSVGDTVCKQTIHEQNMIYIIQKTF